MVLIFLTIYAIRKYNQRKKEKAALEANMGNLADSAGAPLPPYRTQQTLRPVSGGLVPTSELVYLPPRKRGCHSKHDYCGSNKQRASSHGRNNQIYTCKHQRKCANNCNHANPSDPIEKCCYRRKCQRKCAQLNQQPFAGFALADAEAAALRNGWDHDENVAFELTDEQAREFDQAYGHDEEEDHWEQKPELEAVPSAAPPAYTYSDRAMLTTV